MRSQVWAAAAAGAVSAFGEQQSLTELAGSLRNISSLFYMILRLGWELHPLQMKKPYEKNGCLPGKWEFVQDINTTLPRKRLHLVLLVEDKDREG